MLQPAIQTCPSYSQARSAEVLSALGSCAMVGRHDQIAPRRNGQLGAALKARLASPAAATAGKESFEYREDESSNCLYVQRTIHAGELLQHSGSIIVKGDTCRGSFIEADGDIIVLGRLHGRAYAGKSGNRNAIVFALEMQPTEIGVANIVELQPERHSASSAAIALLLLNGRIRIQPASDLLFQGLGKYDKYVPTEIKKLKRVVEDTGGQMKPARMSLFTGAYIFIIGLAVFLFPKPVFGLLFDVRNVTLGWIRVGAVLAMVFGIYYIGTAWGEINGHHGAEAFYLSTVVGRMFLFFSFCWLVGTGAGPPPLLIIGVINLIGAMLMLRALQKSRH